jgi:hypothetical protein
MAASHKFRPSVAEGHGMTIDFEPEVLPRHRSVQPFSQNLFGETEKCAIYWPR